MGYATSDELKLRLGLSTFEEIYPTSVSSAYAQSAVEADLAAAIAEIDGSISVRYSLPVTGESSLALLKDWTLTRAEERAYARCAGSEYTEKVKSRVDQVRKMLELIRTGQFRLPDASEIGSGTGGGPAIALSQSDKPIFTRERMRGF